MASSASKRRAWLRDNVPGYRERDVKAQRRYYYNHPVRRMLYSAKYRAEDKGLTFDLREEDVEVPEYCPALGIKLRYGPGGRGPDSPSLDRLRPEGGYVKTNVRIISDLANRIKQEASVEQIEAVAAWLRKELSPKEHL